MKIYRKIDTTTGNFLEDVLFENDPPFDDGSYISKPVPQGFYLPRWNGTEWVEGGQAPEPVEPEPQAPSEAERIEMLENTLLLLMME
jgi:hypothetical protein